MCSRVIEIIISVSASRLKIDSNRWRNTTGGMLRSRETHLVRKFLDLPTGKCSGVGRLHTTAREIHSRFCDEDAVAPSRWLFCERARAAPACTGCTCRRGTSRVEPTPPGVSSGRFVRHPREHVAPVVRPDPPADWHPRRQPARPHRLLASFCQRRYSRNFICVSISH